MFKKRLRRSFRNGYITKDMLVPDHLDIEVLQIKSDGNRLYALTCYNEDDQVVLKLCMCRECFSEVSDAMKECMTQMDIKEGNPTSNSCARMYH